MSQGLRRSQPSGTRCPTSNRSTIASASRSTLGSGISAAASLLRRSAPISAPATTSAAMRGTRSTRTAASARSNAAKKSSAVMASGVTSTAFISARSNCRSAVISRPYNPRLSAFFSSRSFALTLASFSGPIRISIFCPAERSCNAGSAYSYSTFG